MQTGGETGAINASYDADSLPMPGGATTMHRSKVVGGIARDDTNVREAANAGLADGVKDAVQLRCLLGVDPTRCVRVRGERVKEAGNRKPARRGLRGVTGEEARGAGHTCGGE